MRFFLYLLLLPALPVSAVQVAEAPQKTPIKRATPDTRPAGGSGASDSAPQKPALHSQPARPKAASRKLSTPDGEPVSFAGDADFLAARDAFRAGDAAKLGRFAQRLNNSPLEVYASYYRLRLGLENAGIKEVNDFLSRPEDTPVIDQLRGEWLKLLGKKQQWDMFDAEYPRLLNEDTELACYALQSRLRKQGQAALREVRRWWFSGRGQPESCGTLFEAAFSAGVIGERDIWQRLRLTLEAGNVSLARQLAERLTGNYAVPPAALKSAAADADRYLGKLTLDKANEGQRAVALFALQRLAKQSPGLAAARWSRIEAHFPEAEQHYFYGWLACEAARKLDGRALQWFKAAANSPLNEQQSAWRVRAALRAQDWPEVLAGIDAMGEQQRDATWQYWKARAMQATGKPVEARKLLAPLSGEYNFYGQLAGEELAGLPVLSSAVGPKTGLPASAYKPGNQDIAAMLALPGIQRTLALYRMDMRIEASKEWGWAIRNFSDQELLAAAEIARRNEMYDRAINAADKTVNMHDFNLRYLAPYRDVLQEHIRENGLDEAWVYGLMRQESRFVTAAKSEAGAAGLMQIMPSTARWIAKKLGLKSYKRSLIRQLDTNLRLGTYYMKTVLSWFDDSPVLASAAYNAGPGRARLWRGDQSLEGAIYAETIPFDETRDYVKKVMSNTMYYAGQFNAPPRPLKQRMGIVAGRTADNQQPMQSVRGEPVEP
ncbi:MAG: lytic transglycosylase domain-containing protein [Nitrosomonadales bacterium]|nr:lytic transglycosylase domain-containing protein [Nitrosomonadales bacterium]